MYEFDSRVRYSETDAQGRMTWLALMDYFQDCSVFHSEAVNLGVEVWTDAQKAWHRNALPLLNGQRCGRGNGEHNKQDQRFQRKQTRFLQGKTFC